MRTSRRVSKKTEKNSAAETSECNSNIVVVKPAGYPMRGVFQEYPEFTEMDVFEYYAQEQWSGIVARKGDYLFDKRMFPEFAFKIVDVKPEESVINRNTTFIIEDSEHEPVSPEVNHNISFDDIIGQEHAKQKCRLIERFLEEPEKFGQWAPKNVLFHGPSGTGKTMLARALAGKTKVPLFPIKATQLIGEFVGDGAKQIHHLYERAEEVAPCIIFIDELDAIALDRRFQEIRGDVTEVVNALLTEMDGIVPHEGICTIAATNRIQSLDTSVRSRFEEEIEFTLPNAKERIEILEKYTKTFPLKLARDVNLKEIAEKTQGFSGRDLVEKILKTALHKAIIENKRTVKQRHFEEAVKKITKTSEPPKNMFA
jgi:AAA family ATPase